MKNIIKPALLLGCLLIAFNLFAQEQVPIVAGAVTSFAPICTASDTTAANAVKVATTTITLSLTGTSTDVINYTCMGRN